MLFERQRGAEEEAPRSPSVGSVCELTGCHAGAVMESLERFSAIIPLRGRRHLGAGTVVEHARR